MKKQMRRIVAIIACVSVINMTGCSNDTKNSNANNTSTSEVSTSKEVLSEDVLASWATGDDSTKQKIVGYVTDVTDENSDNFIPLEDRIATFDMDGTFLCEEEISFEVQLMKERVQNDLKDNKELNDEFDTFLKDYASDPQPSETWDLYSDVLIKAFDGMTMDEYVEYAANVMQNVKRDEDQKTFSELVYKPMVELITYLQENDFQVYAVSGSDRATVWGAVEGYNASNPELPLNLDRAHMIGATIKMMADKDDGSGEYVYEQDDKLIRYNEYLVKDIKMDKVTNIANQTGKIPVFAAGNTSGDFSMLNYALSNPDYKTMGLLVWHDDEEREYVYNTDEAYQEMVDTNGWYEISMKNDFTTLY